MTRPASEFHWSPDPIHPHAISAKWTGAPWNYRIEWGDGQYTDMAHWQSPARHLYAAASTRTLRGIPDLPGGVPVDMQATVRDWVIPQVTAMLLDDGHTVRMAVPQVADPVRWRVNWGDGTVSDHGAGDAPEHTYEWGFGAPAIAVTDVPSRRSDSVTGPEIGPAPPQPAGYQGFCFEFVERVGNTRRFVLHGGGMPAGEEISYYRSAAQDWFRTAVADNRGEIHVSLDVEVSSSTDDMWRSYGVSSPTHGRVWVPLRAPAFEADEPQLTYQMHPADTRTLTFSVFPALAGEYHVDYGDGHAETITVDRVPLLATRRYPSGNDYQVTVTLPDGRTATRQVVGSFPCPPCYNANYPGSCMVGWWITGSWCGACGQKGGEHFSPVEISDHYHAPMQIHLPDEPGGSGWSNVYGFGGFTPGVYTFDFRTPLNPPWSHDVTIAKAGARRFGRWVDLFSIDDDEPGQEPLTAWFGDVTEWDGGYKGTFQINNHGDGAAQGAVVEFELADPAVLREVWPSTASFTELGDNRWRITTTATIPPDMGISVGARIEPPGKTRKWPDSITAKPART